MPMARLARGALPDIAEPSSPSRTGDRTSASGTESTARSNARIFMRSRVRGGPTMPSVPGASALTIPSEGVLLLGAPDGG